MRWLILFVAVVAIARLALDWRLGGTFDSLDRGVVAGYSGLPGLQALLGFILLFGNAFLLGEGFPMPRITHSIVMVLAEVPRHLLARWRLAPASLR